MIVGFADHVEKLVDGLLNEITLRNIRLIRIDGVNGVGKTTLGRLLGEGLNAPHLDADDYRLPLSEDSNFLKSADRKAFEAAVRDQLNKQKYVIASSVCLDELLSENDGVASFRIYLMRVDVEAYGLFRWGYKEDIRSASSFGTQLDRTIADYHRMFRPEDKADALMILRSCAAQL